MAIVARQAWRPACSSSGPSAQASTASGDGPMGDEATGCRRGRPSDCARGFWSRAAGEERVLDGADSSSGGVVGGRRLNVQASPNSRTALARESLL